MYRIIFRFAVIFVVVVCSACGGDSNSNTQSQASGNIFNVGNFENRISATSDPVFCGDGLPTEVLESREVVNNQAAVISENDESLDVFSTTFIQPCGTGVWQENSAYTFSDETETISGYYYLKTSAFNTKWYWIYIFANQADITEQVLGDQNLFEVEPSSEIVFPIEFVNLEPVVISIIAVDATSLDNFFLSDSFNSSIRVDRPSSESMAINLPIADGTVALSDPYPELATFRELESNRVEMVFSDFEGGDRETIDFVLLDLQTGGRVQIKCGGFATEITTVRDSGGSATAVICEIPASVSIGEDVILSYRYNLFKGNNAGNYSQFARVLFSE